MRIAIAVIYIAFLLALPAASGAAELVAMRASKNGEYSRLTLIISEEINFKASKDGSRVVIKMRDMDTKVLKGAPSHPVLKLERLEHGRDDSGPYANLYVAVPDGSEVKQMVKSGPYRIIIDVKPPIEFFINSAKPVEDQALVRKEAATVAAFNDSWRWVYRKKAVEALRSSLYGGQAEAEPFNLTLGLSAADDGSASEAALAAADALKKEGEPGKAALMEALVEFQRTGQKHLELESRLRASKDRGLARLGYFLLGAHFERKGFFPEAAGFFRLASEGGTDNRLRAAALFRRARLFFFESKYAEAKDWFKKAIDAGYGAEAWAWLANTCLIKGEMELALDAYSRLGRPVEGLDAVTRLSYGDASLVKGRFREAGFIFAGLRSRFPKEELLSTFLLLKEGDSMLLEGRLTDAIALYNGAKAKLKGDDWAMAALSLADALSIKGDAESLIKAEELYATVVDGQFAGSPVAALRLVPLRIRLGRYPEALASIEKFHARYPTSPLRQDIRRLSSELMYEWIAYLHGSGDHFGAVKLFTDSKLGIPFGRRAETYLRLGKSYMAIGLNSEAIGMLDNAMKMSGGGVAQEAMLALASVYIDQRDTGSAEKIIRTFHARFPGHKRGADIGALEARIAFLKEDYARTARIAEPGQGLASIKAESLAKTGRAKDSAASFGEAATAYESKGDKPAASDAYMRQADMRFSVKDYAKAAEAYARALELADEEEREDRSWALYRLAQCYAKLDRKADEARVLGELKAAGGDIAPWSESIFKEAKSL